MFCMNAKNNESFQMIDSGKSDKSWHFRKFFTDFANLPQLDYTVMIKNLQLFRK